MDLSDAAVSPAIPVKDIGKAKEFYEGKLGLSNGEEADDGGIDYPCGNTTIHPYPSPDNAGKSGATLAYWHVDDVEKTVDELSSKGVTFEQYDMDEMKTNEKGVAEFGDNKGAFFKDQDGNILAIGDS